MVRCRAESLAMAAWSASEGGPRDCTRHLASASGCHCPHHKSLY